MSPTWCRFNGSVDWACLNQRGTVLVLVEVCSLLNAILDVSAKSVIMFSNIIFVLSVSVFDIWGIQLSSFGLVFLNYVIKSCPDRNANQTYVGLISTTMVFYYFFPPWIVVFFYPRSHKNINQTGVGLFILSVSLQSFPSSDITKNKLQHGKGEAKRRKYQCFSKTQTGRDCKRRQEMLHTQNHRQDLHTLHTEDKSKSGFTPAIKTVNTWFNWRGYLQ